MAKDKNMYNLVQNINKHYAHDAYHDIKINSSKQSLPTIWQNVTPDDEDGEVDLKDGPIGLLIRDLKKYNCTLDEFSIFIKMEKPMSIYGRYLGNTLNQLSLVLLPGIGSTL